MKGFNRFLLQFQQDVKQWLFFMLYLSLFRVSFILYFQSRIGPASRLTDVLMTALNGLRYDSMVSTWWTLVPFLASIASGFADLDRVTDRIRTVFGSLFILLTSTAWVFTFVYFREYNEQFNYFIFNLYYDDTKAIMQTIWADYHPIPVLIIISVISAIAFSVKNYLLKRRSTGAAKTIAARQFSLVSRILISLLILSLLIVASRGSIGRRPAQRKDAAISKDDFLNKTVVNPYFSLLFAIQDHILQTGLAGLETYLPDRNVRAAAQELFNESRSFDNLDAYLEKHAKGPKAVPPRHIFLVVMESYDAWPFIKKYASLGLTGNLSRLAKNGIYFKNFVPAADGTRVHQVETMES